MKKSTISAVSLLALSVASASFAASHSNINTPVDPFVEMISVIKVVGPTKARGAFDAINVEPTVMVSAVAKIASPTKEAAVFNAINCAGHVDLTLQPRADDKNSSIKIVRNIYQHIKFRVSHHVLYITESQKTYTGVQPVKLQIPVGNLKMLTVDGHVSVHAKGITAKGLYLSAHTSGTVSLDGHINISQLSATGHSIVNLRWVDSKKLVIKISGMSHTTLSGAVKQAWVHASGHSQFDGLYLRTRQLHADANDYATVKLLPVDNLFAYARDKSEIKVYKKPKYEDKHASGSGNIIQMQWRR